MPPAFADHEVESWWDATLGVGAGPRIAAGAALPVTPDCNHVMFWTRQGAVVSIRASGTEPKIKVSGTVGVGGGWGALRAVVCDASTASSVKTRAQAARRARLVLLLSQQH